MNCCEMTRLLRLSCCLIGLFLVLGCTEGIWKKIDKLEEEALRYGSIAAGAPRIADYDNAELEQARGRLRESLEKIRRELDRPPAPEAGTLNLAERIARLRFSALPTTLPLAAPKSPTGEKSDDSAASARTSGSAGDEGVSSLRNVLEDLSKTAMEPNRIDMTMLRLSALRFMEAELENLNLIKSTPLDDRHYRRVQVSLSLTAWTRLPARAALAYLDLYPYSGDWWCHKLTGYALEKARTVLSDQPKQNPPPDKTAQISAVKIAEPPLNNELKELESLLGAIQRERDSNRLNFENSVSAALAEGQQLEERRGELERTIDDPPFPSVRELTKWLGYEDPYAGCHAWLEQNHLLPKLIYVEPLPNPRYVLESRAGLSAYDIGAEVPTPKGSIEAAYQNKDISARREAAIRITALSFAAGERRAEWFFLKGEGDQEMSPIETRVRMVVEIPRRLKKLEIHVHKIFLGKTFLGDHYEQLTPFERQTRDSHDARKILNEIEAQVDRLNELRKLPQPEHAREMRRAETFPTTAYWQLAKSRVRNLLSLGWSERLLLDIPNQEPREPSQYAIQGLVVSASGASEGFVAIKDGMIEGVYRKLAEVPGGFKIFDDYKHDFIYPGFIDTHNHPNYNFVPKWDPSPLSSGACRPFYCNRYEWWEDPEYLRSVKGTKESLDRYGYTLDGLIYGHVRALVGGVTTIQGGRNPGVRPSLLQNMWNGYEAQTGKIRELSENGSLKRFRDDLELGIIKRLFLHVGEGIDEASRAEVDLLEAAGLLRPELVLIHAIPLGDKELDKIRQSGARLVWSPSSNLALYGKTMDVAKAFAKGIDVALAPDWTITGSSNILQEVQCAHEYGKAVDLSEVLTPQRIYLMITETAARVAGLEGKAGRIAKGFQADLLIMKRKNDSPYDNLLVAGPGDIRLVLINGQFALGEPKASRFLETRNSFDFVDLGDAVRAVRLTSKEDSGGLPQGYSLETVRRHLGAVSTFAPVVESPNCKIPSRAQ